MKKLLEFIKDYEDQEEPFPEKWSIEVDEENIHLLSKYLHENNSKYKSYRKTWNLKNADGYYFVSEQIPTEPCWGFSSNNHRKQLVIDNGFVLITNEELFKQFKK